ncbi:MAG TPA: hypothetical protein VHD81_07695 [Mycobacteriales bacterium]|nr:hypothetical protein [Mycobacteriales bacterium]
MRTILRVAGVAAVLFAASCSSSGSSPRSAPTAPTPHAAARANYAVPKHVKGELARAEFGGSNFERAAEALPKPKMSYAAVLGCVASDPAKTSMHWEVRLASTKVTPPIVGGSVPCDGQRTTGGLPALKHWPIQIEIDWVGTPGTRAYGVVQPL